MFRPQIIIVPDKEVMGEFVALLIVKGIDDGWMKVLGCATGNTSKPVYKALAGMYQRNEVSFSEVIFFNLDEYVRNPGNKYLKAGNKSKASYTRFMWYYLFRHIDACHRNCHIPNPFNCRSNQEIDEMCVRYEEQIKQAGGIDLQLLGLGPLCHIAFNFPNSTEDSRTRKVKIDDPTREANKFDFGNDSKNVPLEAVTMGLATIMETKQKIIMATGEHKAPHVRDFIDGEFSVLQRPAKILSKDPKTLVVLDEAAASGLVDKDNYLRWNIGRPLPHILWNSSSTPNRVCDWAKGC